MMNTIIHDLPLGVALVLNVGDREQFASRPLHTAPDTTEAVTEHLLDGQQRLTALYRALRDNDDAVTYFLHVPDLDEDSHGDEEDVSVQLVRRWRDRKDTRYPIWTDSPRECLSRGLLPVRLLDPTRDDTAQWVDAATAHLMPGKDITDGPEIHRMFGHATATQDRVKKLLSDKREVVRHFNLPYLRLPASTSKETALSVFVNMNTNAKPLSAHDIVVAELESVTGSRLKEMEADLDAALPRLRGFVDLPSAVLQTSALLQGKLPGQRGFFDMDHRLLVDNWQRLTHGFHRAVELIESLHILDRDRLPSTVPVPVIAALLADEPDAGDRRAAADRLMRAYAWRSFFTDRYGSAAATRAASDHRGLRARLDGDTTAGVPVFDEDVYPLPTAGELTAASWPRAKRSLPRAILAASTYFGARDLADDTAISAQNIGRREYHHVFPKRLLEEAGIESMLALNCMLITWRTNREIGRLDPLVYLERRAQAAPEPRDLHYRLDTHLVPAEAVIAAGPYDKFSGAQLRGAVEPDFRRFLEQRATLVQRFIARVCVGDQPRVDDIASAEPRQP